VLDNVYYIFQKSIWMNWTCIYWNGEGLSPHII